MKFYIWLVNGSRKKPESNGCHESHVPAPWQYGSYRQDIKMQDVYKRQLPLFAQENGTPRKQAISQKDIFISFDCVKHLVLSLIHI